jgi:hypothetical protein
MMRVRRPGRIELFPQGLQYTTAAMVFDGQQWKQFWSDFSPEHWEKKPGVFRGALSSSPVTERQLLQTLCSSMSDDSLGTGGDAKIFFGSEMVAPAMVPRLGQALGSADDYDGLQAYLEQLSEILGNQKFGIHLTRIESRGTGLWDVFQQLAAPIVETVGPPSGALHGAAFLGSYQRSLFGPHRDRSSVISFPLLGKKSILVWPPRYFEERGIETDGENVLDPGHDAFLADAQELTGGPGDILYWPSTYWHTPLQKEDGLHATVALGYWFSCALCPHHATLWA